MILNQVNKKKAATNPVGVGEKKNMLAALNPCSIPTFMANPFWPWEIYPLVNVYIAVENHHAISV